LFSITILYFHLHFKLNLFSDAYFVLCILSYELNLLAMNFETSLLSNNDLESSGSVKSNHFKEFEKQNIKDDGSLKNEEMEEDENPREILRQFLERSLSQSAKSSLMHIKPEGM